MKQGFTLIEMMVAVSIFVIVAMITTGALITISDVNRKAQAIKIAMDNVSFAMDSMVLNLREGTGFDCTGTNLGCGGGDNETLVFGSKRIGSNPGNTIRYRFAETNGVGRIEVSKDGGATYASLTSPEVDISGLSFYVSNTGGFGGSGEKPRVTIVIRGEVPGKTSTKFNLQTTIKANF